MIRHPPTFTFFPYTTLFRSRQEIYAAGFGSGVAVVPIAGEKFHNTSCAPRKSHWVPGRAAGVMEFLRSEEHTSELQSRPHLVCRLLLEKKKNTTKTQS